MIEPMPSPGDQGIRDLPIDLFARVCDEFQAMGASSVVLTGEGEPLLSRHLLSMIAMAKDAGLHVKLYTNGILLDKSWAQPLVDARLDVLRVSLWGSSRQEYERNYPGSAPSNFDQIMDGLQHLSEAKASRGSRLPAVALRQPTTRRNFQNMEAMVDLAQATGCGMLSFSPFKTRRGELSSMALSPDEESQVRHTLSRMAGRLNSLGIKHNIDKTLIRYQIGEAVWQELACYMGWLHVRIKVDGTVFPCNPCDLPMGNLNQHSLHEIWNGSALQDFRQKVLTHKGLVELGGHCDCGFCCHVMDNRRVHQVFRWLGPLSARSGRE